MRLSRVVVLCILIVIASSGRARADDEEGLRVQALLVRALTEQASTDLRVRYTEIVARRGGPKQYEWTICGGILRGDWGYRCRKPSIIPGVSVYEEVCVRVGDTFMRGTRSDSEWNARIFNYAPARLDRSSPTLLYWFPPGDQNLIQLLDRFPPVAASITDKGIECVMAATERISGINRQPGLRVTGLFGYRFVGVPFEGTYVLERCEQLVTVDSIGHDELVGDVPSEVIGNHEVGVSISWRWHDFRRVGKAAVPFQWTLKSGPREERAAIQEGSVQVLDAGSPGCPPEMRQPADWTGRGSLVDERNGTIVLNQQAVTSPSAAALVQRARDLGARRDSRSPGFTVLQWIGIVVFATGALVLLGLILRRRSS